MTETGTPGIKEKKDSPRRRVMVFDLAAPNNVKILARLCELKNWIPVHWFGSLPKQGDLIRNLFPNVEYYSKRNLILRQFPNSLPHTEWPRRDADVIQHLAKYDPVLYPVFLREARSLYGMDNMAEYHEVITTWYYFFEQVNPALVVFGLTPALVYDYLSYLICQERGIPTLMLFRHHHVPGVIMPSNRFEEPPPRIAARYRELIETNLYQNIKLDEHWQQYLDRMSGTYEDAMYKGFSRRYEVDHKKDYVRLRDTIPRKFIDVLTGQRSVFYARALAREILTLPRRWLLRWSYERKTIKPDYNIPYIFVPLHVQPERTSIPRGGIFGHQLLMIEILSRTLPQGWLLYVKEHPVQLYDRPVFKLFRTPAFYKELTRFPNVRLVPSRIIARKLIDHSRAVASVTSTACWEALFRGKPALVFGHEWYNFCDGVFHTSTYDKCAQAMSAIKTGYTIDHNKLKACLYVIQEEGVPLLSRNLSIDNAKVRIRTCAERLAEQINADGMIRVPDNSDRQRPDMTMLEQDVNK